jgi:hypothetical protein
MPTERTSAHTLVRYEVFEEPDLQDTSSERRRVIRPRQVELHIEPFTNQVLYAVIEGRQMRADGEYPKRRTAQQIIVSSDPLNAAAPPWLNELLHAERLEWAPGRRPRPARQIAIAPAAA